MEQQDKEVGKKITSIYIDEEVLQKIQQMPGKGLGDKINFLYLANIKKKSIQTSQEEEAHYLREKIAKIGERLILDTRRLLELEIYLEADIKIKEKLAEIPHLQDLKEKWKQYIKPLLKSPQKYDKQQLLSRWKYYCQGTEEQLDNLLAEEQLESTQPIPKYEYEKQNKDTEVDTDE